MERNSEQSSLFSGELLFMVLEKELKVCLEVWECAIKFKSKWSYVRPSLVIAQPGYIGVLSKMQIDS